MQGVVDRLSEFRCGQGTRIADARRICGKAMRASEWPPRLELPRRAAAHRAALRGDATASPVATARTAKLRKPRRRFPAGFNRQRDPSRACDLFSLRPELSPRRSEAKRSELSRTLYAGTVRNWPRNPYSSDYATPRAPRPWGEVLAAAPWVTRFDAARLVLHCQRFTPPRNAEPQPTLMHREKLRRRRPDAECGSRRALPVRLDFE